MFWSTVVAKTIDGEVQLHALVDGKRIIITESTVKRDIQLEDAEDIDCLPNSTIFEQLALIRYENVSQKLTFYKPFFSPQWKFLIHTILQCWELKAFILSTVKPRVSTAQVTTASTNLLE
ncbi:hypothetical protein Tco_0958446 [Tanacetum coccineum]